MDVVDAYLGLEPAHLWRHFAALNAIPRPSGGESRARDYVLGVATRAGIRTEVDARGNTIVRVPAQPGVTGPVVAIQGHLDMVCDAEPGVAHDWARDPIVPRRDGDRVFASGTTLGADNGIGVAACLSLIEAKDVRHGGLELLFTVDEERGPWGVLDLDVSLLDAEALINLDSEDADALTIGAAGGSAIEIGMPLALEATPDDARGVEIRLAGLRGGHSGVQIHEGNANAIKLMAAVLGRLHGDGVETRLGSLRGGSTATAIPRHARAALAIAGDRLADAEALVAELGDDLRSIWSATEPDLTLELEAGPVPEAALTEGSALRLLTLLDELPHGVLATGERFAGVVETSANLATIEVVGGEATVITSARSLSVDRLREVEDLIREVAAKQTASATVIDDYPSWEPRERSHLVDVAAAAYLQAYGREPRLDVLHGGLECGAIVAAKPSLEAISFGPRIVGAHTPEEHVYASTVATTWALLKGLLERLADQR